jgi:hypothetical protein
VREQQISGIPVGKQQLESRGILRGFDQHSSERDPHRPAAAAAAKEIRKCWV